MSPADLFDLGLLGIRTRKARAALSALGIAIGIATLLVVTGIPASSRQALDRQLDALGTNRLQAAPVPDRDPPVVLPAESVGMVSRIGPVTVASAVADFGLTVARTDHAAAGDFNALAVLAARNNLLDAINGTLRSGRFLDDAMAQFPTVVLGSVAAERLGRPPMVYIGHRWFAVIGILAPVPLAPDIDRSVLIGWAAAGKWLRFTGHPTRIYVQTTDDQVEAVRGVLAATVDPAHPGDVLVGGIGVANTMYISVLERRREIGLRRALGANRGQVRIQFLAESVVLSVLGGGAGIFFGVVATAAYGAMQGWPLVVPRLATVGGLGGALVIGVLAGVYPAVRAARLHPTSALSSF